MKIFISWSSTRSKFVAETLRGWLPRVIQAVKPWMSNEDISTGSRWAGEIANELEASGFGIICVTPENQNNPWLLFETGALSKTIIQSFVCPYLYDMPTSELTGPLSQFQAAIANKEGTKKLIVSVNKALGESSIKENELDEIFEVWWPRLQERLSETPKLTDIAIPKRSTEDLIKEILENTREQLRRGEIRIRQTLEMDERMQKVLQVFNDILMVDLRPSAQGIDELKSKLLSSLTIKANVLPETSARTLESSSVVELLSKVDAPSVAGMAEALKQLQDVLDLSQIHSKALLENNAHPASTSEDESDVKTPGPDQ